MIAPCSLRSSSSSGSVGGATVSWLLAVGSVLLLSMLISPCNGNNNGDAQQQECDANNPSRQDAQVLINNELFTLKDNESKFPKQTYKNPNDEGAEDELFYYILREDKPVLYVPNFLNETTSQEIKDFCLQPVNRFERSPVRGKTLEEENQDNDEDEYVNNKSELRTSESCALVPAALYLSKPNIVEMMNDPNASPQVVQVKRQVDVSWDIATRASSIISVSPTTVEPLQLVRYTTPTAQYKVHHDHGGYVSFFVSFMKNKPFFQRDLRTQLTLISPLLSSCLELLTCENTNTTSLSQLLLHIHYFYYQYVVST